MASPALVSTKTRWPREESSRTAAGIMPTRYSLFLISLGTPIFMSAPSVASRHLPRERGRKHIHAAHLSSPATRGRWRPRLRAGGTGGGRWMASIDRFQYRAHTIDHAADLAFARDQSGHQPDRIAADRH